MLPPGRVAVSQPTKRLTSYSGKRSPAPTAAAAAAAAAHRGVKPTQTFTLHRYGDRDDAGTASFGCMAARYFLEPLPRHCMQAPKVSRPVIAMIHTSHMLLLPPPEGPSPDEQHMWPATWFWFHPLDTCTCVNCMLQPDEQISEIFKAII